MTQKKREHYVLLGPKGKQAGHKNQHRVALELRAIELTRAGMGGGIISLLMPRSKKRADKLREYIDRGYTVRAVPIRDSSRRDVREAIASDELLATLLAHFDREKQLAKNEIRAHVREFSTWVCEKLSDHRPNQVRRLVREAHPDLADRTSPDWWRKQIARRKK
jgi:hypothetical protein